MKKKCSIDLPKYYIFSRCLFFHLRPAVESHLIPSLLSKSDHCLALVESQHGFTKFPLSTLSLAYVHTPINQHICVEFKHHFFTKSDRFTNTV